MVSIVLLTILSCVVIGRERCSEVWPCQKNYSVGRWEQGRCDPQRRHGPSDNTYARHSLAVNRKVVNWKARPPIFSIRTETIILGGLVLDDATFNRENIDT
jgi:hypothetical protein